MNAPISANAVSVGGGPTEFALAFEVRRYDGDGDDGVLLNRQDVFIPATLAPWLIAALRTQVAAHGAGGAAGQMEKAG